jgi:DNA modification methylase
VDLVVTSPPFPLTFQKKKPYESVSADRYVGWFLAYADQCKRLLKENGSLIIDIGGVWNRGMPTRNLYQYHLLIALCEQLGFHLAQDFYWYNPGSLAAPAEWVNVRRIRVRRRHGRRRTTKTC